MNSFPLMLSSLSRCFPMSSVPFLGLRPPPAPPPESPSPPISPEPPDPPDPQISSLPGKAHAQPLLWLHLTGPQRFHCESEPPSPPPSKSVPPCRKSIPRSTAAPPCHSSRRRHHCKLHIPCSNVNLGFYCLGQKWVDCLLGLKWMICLLGQKLKVFFLDATALTPMPFSPRYRAVTLDLIHLKPFQTIETRLLLSFDVSNIVCSFSGSVSVSIPPIRFPQVCSYYSLSNSSILRSYWMIVENVALVLWNSGIALTPLMILDTLGSKFILSSGTLIALVRNFTAVCRFYFELALLEVSLLQIVKRYLLSLVHRGSRSPHLSFKELIILPNTSLVFSGIVIGSIVVKIVLLGAEARIVVQDFSRSAIADSLTLEALFPLHLVEPMSSPLSLSLYLSFVVFFSLPSYSITLLIFVFGVLALCCLLVSSIDGG